MFYLGKGKDKTREGRISGERQCIAGKKTSIPPFLKNTAKHPSRQNFRMRFE
jgi:hypothetical protein